MAAWLMSTGCPPQQLRLGAVDRGFLAGPVGRPIPAAALLDFTGRPPSVQDLRERVAERAERLPALHYSLSGDGKSARWSGRLDPAQHVRVLAAGEGESESDRGAELLLAQGPPARDSRPPWEVVLISRPGGYSLGFHGDHALFDGVLIRTLLRTLIDDDPAAGAALPRPERPRPAGIADTLAQQAALWRTTEPAPAFATPSGGPRQVRHADVALSHIRGLARAYGVTVNDIYLAALAHAVCLWQRDGTHPPVEAAMPVSFRRPGEEGELGNRMALARIVLPCDDSSPMEALRRVAAQTARQKRLRQRDALRVLSALTPGAAAVWFAPRLAHTLIASNVAFGSTLTHRGDVAHAAYGVIDVHGLHQCFAGLVGYQDTARFTVIHHPDAPIGAVLPSLWLDALRALEEHATVSGPR
ncbi:wax ester/triacylglycerol synthase domain-containing protein [Streptomyces sp. NPDC059443]|uniref:wax ester/triacylglycerol synthase domain-containing protein n=1 Tax=unclassified Streptomyces TaxID=2593676 RepID=UPI0036C704AC